MARIRTIKPEFWRHEDLSSLAEATHMLAAALLNYADDEGYFNANPKLIRAECSPLREPTVPIETSIAELARVGYLELGQGADGRSYGRIVNFGSHQVISRPKASKISGLDISWIDHGSIMDSSVPEQGTGKGTGNREQVNVAASSATIERKAFEKEFHESFYPAYPHKVGKADALKSFQRARQKATLETILAGLERYKRSKPADRQWCNPATWLNQERWLDQPAEPGKVNGSSFAPSFPRWFDVRYDYEQRYGKADALARYTEDARAAAAGGAKH